MTKRFIFFITIRADFDEFDEKQFRGRKQTKQKETGQALPKSPTGKLITLIN